MFNTIGLTRSVGPCDHCYLLCLLLPEKSRSDHNMIAVTGIVGQIVAGPLVASKGPGRIEFSLSSNCKVACYKLDMAL